MSEKLPIFVEQPLKVSEERKKTCVRRMKNVQDDFIFIFFSYFSCCRSCRLFDSLPGCQSMMTTITNVAVIIPDKWLGPAESSHWSESPHLPRPRLPIGRPAPRTAAPLQTSRVTEGHRCGHSTVIYHPVENTETENKFVNLVDLDLSVERRIAWLKTN